MEDFYVFEENSILRFREKKEEFKDILGAK